MSNMLLFENTYTHFAPAERLALDRVLAQSQAVAKFHDLHNVFNAFPNVIMILNEYRQVVYGNQALLDLLNIHDTSQILGARPGEVLNCIHARKNEPGCGTSENCSTCGAALAILTSQSGKEAARECRLIVKKGDEYVSLDLLFSAKPFELAGQHFTIVFVTDISHEKRRRALERIFFHDILNTAGSLRGVVELLGHTKDPAKVKELLQDLEEVSASLIEEILEQRDLVSAENNELRVNREPVESGELLNYIIHQLSNHPAARGIFLKVDEATENVSFVTDPVLLKRVLGNMVKNALEASKTGDTVTLGVMKKERRVQFWVNNPLAMSREVQLQVFQRSFSTKGSGRGLGTYSMKLLTERYLKGTISFVVNEEKGTTFIASYPLHLSDE
ncbi:Histidine kinase-, DNA gyrase B-, and HSP90-like ATPase [Desulforamulus putei DSM 12395]|uniref:Histidine kinase-, DNA gyrase B-, and HSP90-like ATPase n=1 Tax=Desulforamulus putei DSM 12395 TaxID=1121429 RepID=A0A1M5A6W6_9FIRM|nr:HAMP domain-containing sensor histidine kinase [Desulforamulus putei]SHF25786.1 Histidine kinase-, DNA gyrase B-, and HSP90-like ATPase [Desulforamulus putei DSM 12395]